MTADADADAEGHGDGWEGRRHDDDAEKKIIKNDFKKINEDE